MRPVGPPGAKSTNGAGKVPFEKLEVDVNIVHGELMPDVIEKQVKEPSGSARHRIPALLDGLKPLGSTGEKSTKLDLASIGLPPGMA